MWGDAVTNGIIIRLNKAYLYLDLSLDFTFDNANL